MRHDTLRLSRAPSGARRSRSASPAANGDAASATPPAAGARSAVEPANRLGRYRLRRDGLDAEQVHGVAIVQAIAGRQVTADGDDEVVSARGEDGTGVPDHRAAVHRLEHIAQLPRGGIAVVVDRLQIGE